MSKKKTNKIKLSLSMEEIQAIFVVCKITADNIGPDKEPKMFYLVSQKLKKLIKENLTPEEIQEVKKQIPDF